MKFFTDVELICLTVVIILPLLFTICWVWFSIEEYLMLKRNYRKSLDDINQN